MDHNQWPVPVKTKGIKRGRLELRKTLNKYRTYTAPILTSNNAKKSIVCLCGKLIHFFTFKMFLWRGIVEEQRRLHIAEPGMYLKIKFC